MGTAAYVGRVGGLAVALGVGSAVFAGHGVAWADDTDSSASKPSASATSQSDTSDDNKPTTKADRAAKAEAEDDTSSDEDTESEDAGAEDVDSGEEADADEDTDPAAEDEPDAAPDVVPEDEAAPAEEPDAQQETSPETAPSAEPETATAADPETDTAASDDVTTEPTTKATADKSDDPAVPPQDAVTVTVSTTTSTTTAAALLTTQTADAATKKPNLITAIVNVVNSMIDWAHQKADTKPGDAPQPPFLWALLSFARRELDNLFVARSSTSIESRSTAVASTSLALNEATTTAALAAANSPWLNPQVSASTRFIDWVTGPWANIPGRFDIYGTDLGIMWDNGMVDNPATPYNEHQILIAVGDSFGSPGMTGRYIYNTLFRSNDHDLSNGMDIPNGEWFNGNMFGGAPLSGPTQARPIINRPSWLPGSVTLIPTAGVSIVTPDDPLAKFGVTQYVSFMSVTKWGQAGRWTTNYSAVAYSYDNGENFTVAPESVRYNSFLSGNRNFQQSAYVKGDDGYVYVYGTPNGRQGAAYLARVSEENILDVSKYEYYKKASSGWFGSTTPARWVKGSPSSASAIIGKSGGLFGFTKPGYTVSEMSVQYNEYLKKYVVLYGDQSNRIVMRTSDTPEGVWSDATVLMNQQTGGIYAPMLHPWSPSTEGVGSKLYWNLSLWSDYNVMLMETDLTKL